MLIRRFGFSIFSALVFALALAGCRPSENEFIEDFDLVFTTFDTNYNFSGKSTFLMPDSVIIVGAEDNAEAHRFDAFILEALSRYMTGLGWEKLDPEDGAPADLVLLPMVTTAEFSSCVMPCWECGWDYWGGWGAWGAPPGPGWGWGYPPIMGCSSFSTGSLYVTLSDPNNVNEISEEIPVVWTGILNGFLLGSDAGMVNRLESNLSQMFAQSPYLKTQP